MGTRAVRKPSPNSYPLFASQRNVEICFQLRLYYFYELEWNDGCFALYIWSLLDTIYTQVSLMLQQWLVVHLKTNDYEPGQRDCNVLYSSIYHELEILRTKHPKIKETWSILQIYLRCILLNFRTKKPIIENWQNLFSVLFKGTTYFLDWKWGHLRRMVIYWTIIY